MLKPKKKLTPKKAYRIIKKRAREAGQSMRDYCKARGVSHSTVSRWKNKPDTADILNSTAELLGLV